MHVGAFLNTPTVARAKYVEQVINTVQTLSILNLATFRTIVLDLTCTESCNGERSPHENEEAAGANRSSKPPVLAEFVRQVAGRTATLPRHVVVLCELPTPRVIRAIKKCLPSSFNVEVLLSSPEIELAIRLAVTPAGELVALDVASTTRLHVAISPQTVRVIETALHRLKKLVRLQLTNIRVHALVETLRVDNASLPLLETFGAEIDDVCYCYEVTCTCLIVTAQIYDSLFERGNGTCTLQSLSLVNVRVHEEKIANLVTAKRLRSMNLHISALHHEEDLCFDAGLQARVHAIFDESDLERFTVIFEERVVDEDEHGVDETMEGEEEDAEDEDSARVL